MRPILRHRADGFAFRIFGRGRTRVGEVSIFGPAWSLWRCERTDANGFRHAFQSIAACRQKQEATGPTCGHAEQLGVEANGGIGRDLDRERLERLMFPREAAAEERADIHRIPLGALAFLLLALGGGGPGGFGLILRFLGEGRNGGSEGDEKAESECGLKHGRESIQM